MKKKILIADDQRGIRELLKIALNDYEVREATNGKEELSNGFLTSL